MKYTIVEKEAFAVFGKQQTVAGDNSQAEISDLWDIHYRTGKNKKICGKYGVCYSDDFGADILYCIADDYVEGIDLPEGCDIIKFESGSWAVFEGKGAIPEAIVHLSQQIFSEWIGTESEYEISDNFNIEIYSDASKFENGVLDNNYEFEVWVPVMKKI